MTDARIYYVNEQGCQVWVIPDYLTAQQADELHTEITSLPLIQHYLGKMWGKDVYQPRLSIGLGRGYAYSGRVRPAVDWCQAPLAEQYQKQLNTEFGTSFNGGLVNYYRDGSDYIAAHSDDEQTLSKAGAVFGLSTGSRRDMVLRWKLNPTNKPRVVIPLATGSLFAMEGDTQRLMTHEMPVRKRAGARGSVTYRQYKE